MQEPPPLLLKRSRTGDRPRETAPHVSETASTASSQTAMVLFLLLTSPGHHREASRPPKPYPFPCKGLWSHHSRPYSAASGYALNSASRMNPKISCVPERLVKRIVQDELWRPILVLRDCSARTTFGTVTHPFLRYMRAARSEVIHSDRHGYQPMMLCTCAHLLPRRCQAVATHTREPDEQELARRAVMDILGPGRTCPVTIEISIK